MFGVQAARCFQSTERVGTALKAKDPAFLVVRRRTEATHRNRRIRSFRLAEGRRTLQGRRVLETARSPRPWGRAARSRRTSSGPARKFVVPHPGDETKLHAYTWLERPTSDMSVRGIDSRFEPTQNRAISPRDAELPLRPVREDRPLRRGMVRHAWSAHPHPAKETTRWQQDSSMLMKSTFELLA